LSGGDCLQLAAGRYGAQEQRKPLTQGEADGDYEPGHGRGGYADEQGPESCSYEEAAGEHCAQEAHSSSAYAAVTTVDSPRSLEPAFSIPASSEVLEVPIFVELQLRHFAYYLDIAVT
jgi:hypothetical protein